MNIFRTKAKPVAPPPEVVRLDLPASYAYLSLLGACLSDIIARIDGLGEADIVAYNVQLAVHETCTNIIGHAYGEQAAGRIRIEITLQHAPRRLIVDLHDTGRTFDLDAVPEPSLDDVQVHGYGLFLIRELMDEVSYTPRTGDNRWRLVKYLGEG
jgi:serine/threonine-protein kinase RsbW